MHHIYSTLTASQVYTQTKPGGGDIPVETGRVFIAGGTNVPNKYMTTPRGVVTSVSDEELAILQDNDVFRAHVKNGFITIQKAPQDVEKVTADMERRDKSAPLIEEDFQDKPAEERPKVNAKRSSRRA